MGNGTSTGELPAPEKRVKLQLVFVDRSVFAEDRKLPRYQDVPADKKKTVTFWSDMFLKSPEEISEELREFLLVSHKWMEFWHADAHDTQRPAINKYLDIHPEKKWVWYDWCSLPQELKDQSKNHEAITEPLTEEQHQYRSDVLKSINCAFLAFDVLILWDQDFQQRFWCVYETFLAMHGLDDGRIVELETEVAKRRVTIEVLGGTTFLPGAEAVARNCINNLWKICGETTIDQMLEYCKKAKQSKELKVTNESDIDYQTARLQDLNDKLKHHLDALKKEEAEKEKQKQMRESSVMSQMLDVISTLVAAQKQMQEKMDRMEQWQKQHLERYELQEAWNLQQTSALSRTGDESKARHMKEFTSVKDVVQHLRNKPESCPEGFCIVTSKSSKQNVLVYRRDMKSKAFSEFDIREEEPALFSVDTRKTLCKIDTQADFGEASQGIVEAKYLGSDNGSKGDLARVSNPHLCSLTVYEDIVNLDHLPDEVDRLRSGVRSHDRFWNDHSTDVHNLFQRSLLELEERHGTSFTLSDVSVTMSEAQKARPEGASIRGQKGYSEGKPSASLRLQIGSSCSATSPTDARHGPGAGQRPSRLGRQGTLPGSTLQHRGSTSSKPGSGPPSAR